MAVDGGRDPPLVGSLGEARKELYFLSVRGGIVPLSNAWVTRPKAIKAKVVFPPAGVSDKEGWRLG